MSPHSASPRSASLPHLACTPSAEGAAPATCSRICCGSELQDPHRPAIGCRSTAAEAIREAALRAWSEALAAGDARRAIEILWELHSDDVFRYCRRMVGHDAEAADVTQKVFVHAIRSLGRLRSVEHPGRWLIGIARHRCLDHARSARRAPQLVDASTLCEIAGAAFIAEAPDEDPRTVQLLGECLARLDARDRTLIELRFYQGLPYKQIATQLGTTPAALRVRLMRARFLLRRYLNARLMKSARHEPQAVLRDPHCRRSQPSRHHRDACHAIGEPAAGRKIDHPRDTVSRTLAACGS
jgi:RNA polymerase sigma-70 factor, ECF subfamily